MNEEIKILKSVIIKLVDILESSCTSENSTRGDAEQHEHDLFDETDKHQLDNLLTKLMEIK